MLHVCSPTTYPPCEKTKYLMISQLFNDSAVSHAPSPALIDAVYERLHRLEGLWSRYAFVDLPFGEFVRELNADMYYLFKGSLTSPPCTEDVTCVVFFFLPPLTQGKYTSFPPLILFFNIKNGWDSNLVSNFQSGALAIFS